MSAVRFLLLLLCLSLSPPPSLSQSEAEALLALKKSMSNTEKLASWKENSNPCEDRWEGVFCEDGRHTIIRLHLGKMNLSGTVDIDALTQITFLKTLSLSNNSFSGTLPAFNRLTGLKALYLSANKFSGEIPGDFFGKTTLRRIWLSDNEFTGKIPDSLGKLPSLSALHLERNKFSGPIPDISQTSLTELDVSNNQLEGEVPASMERFGANAFKGNAGACGKLVGTDCKTAPAPAQVPTTRARERPRGNVKTTLGVMIGIVVIMALLLIFTTMVKPKNEEGLDEYGDRRRQSRDDDVEVRVPGTGARSGGGGGSTRNNSSHGGGGGGGSVSGGSSHKKGSEHGGSRRGAQAAKNALGDLTMINDEKGTFGLADLMKAAAEVLGNGGLGSAYKAVMSNGVSVVVKRIRDMNKLEKEEFDIAIRKFGKLRHKNILTPLAYHYRKEEKLVVSEYVSRGSLLYVLHGDRGTNHADLNWLTRVKIIKGIASGMKFLQAEFFSYELPHGNLKSSNVLLGQDYEPLLSDYAYIKMVSLEQAAQGMFAYRAPEAGENQPISPKADVYCLGIIILEVLTRKFPSQYLNAGKGGTDVVQWARSAIAENNEAEFLDPEMVSSSNDSLPAMIQLLHDGAAYTESNLHKRPSLEEAIKRIERIQA